MSFVLCGVVIPGRAASLIDQLVSRDEIAARMTELANREGLPPETIKEVLDAWRGLEQASDGHKLLSKARRAGSANGTTAGSANAGSGTVDEMLTTEQAAAVLGVSTGRVRRLARLQVITGRRIGRAWQLKASSVHSYAANRFKERP